MSDRRLNITERGGTRTSDITTIRTAPQNQMRVASVEWYCGEAVGSRATEKSNARQMFPKMLRRRSQVEGARPGSAGLSMAIASGAEAIAGVGPLAPGSDSGDGASLTGCADDIAAL
jgi:hypothetical protein